MNNTIRIEINVTRTAVDGSTRTGTAIVTGAREERGLNPIWLADRLGAKALKLVDPVYWEVTKTVSEASAPPPEDPASPRQ